MGEIIEKRRRGYSGLDADKASIPAGGKEVNDTYLATDTKILYFWDGVAWIIIPLDVLVAGMAKAGFGRYVPRETGTWDWRESDLTLDGAWHSDGAGLDCATDAGVPAGATAICIGGTIKNDVIDTKLRIRQNAGAGDTEFAWWVLVANLYMPYFYSIIPCDSDRFLDYNASAGVDYIGMVVTGWVI